MIDQVTAHPDHAATRLRYLQASGLLDSASEAAFDRLTWLGAHVLQAPIALVTLVDADRQFFKSSYGLAEPLLSARETPLAYSFCRHVVEQRQPLIVCNSLLHRLVQDNPAIQAMGVGSYIGFPLRTADEIVLGAFCVIDHHERLWQPQDLEIADQLAQLVMTEINLRAEVRRRSAIERELRESHGQLERRVEQRTAELGREVENRRVAEGEIAAKACELERSNRDLEQFAYLASHDLQEPLRMVNGFIGLTLRRHADRLDEKGREYLATAADGALRMSRMIKDLLAYSRVDRVAIADLAIDCDAALDEALRNLQPAIAESGARIERSPLPRARIAHTQLVLLLQNLIGNAIKYRGASAPEISIRAIIEQDAVRLMVSDNGIGIPQPDQERIFGFFQRLHGPGGPGTVPGSGMGLAICKKIVDRHGGRIWVDSVPGHGATFQVLLRG